MGMIGFVAVVDKVWNWIFQAFDNHPVLSFTVLFILGIVCSILMWKNRHEDIDWD